jgi:hypothetical protein
MTARDGGIEMTQRQNPYCGFTDGKERRRALNGRVMWPSLAAMVAAIAGSQFLWKGGLQWLMHWFQ